MEDFVGFFRAYELWVNLVLGLAGLFFVRKFSSAWRELRNAVFGLERESAQGRLNQATGALVILLIMAIAEFILVSFVAPALPGALSTPTLNLLATTTITLSANETQLSPAEAPGQPTLAVLSTSNGCTTGQIEITFPQNGQEVSGVIEIMGSATIANFGFYKFEIKRPDETAWLTIQAGNTAVRAGKLGDWDTSRLTPGDYQLGLVVVDNQAKASSPCIVQVRVVAAPGATRGP